MPSQWYGDNNEANQLEPVIHTVKSVMYLESSHVRILVPLQPISRVIYIASFSSRKKRRRNEQAGTSRHKKHTHHELVVKQYFDHDGGRFGDYSSGTERREGLRDWCHWMARCQV
jgi:hypothetical protein